MRRVLITGAGGRVGRILVTALHDEWTVRAGYESEAQLASSERPAGVEATVCDITRPDQVASAVDGCDAVVHLASAMDAAPVEDVARVNIVGTTHLLDACLRGAVRRFVLASSNHVVGGHEVYADDRPPALTLGEDASAWPDSHYGASKLYCEGIARWYVSRSRNRMTAACIRIGTTGFPIDDELMSNERMWSTWLSDRDLCQLFRQALDADIEFGVYYGISNNSRRFWSLEAARDELGYEPADDAEQYAKTADSKGYVLPPWLKELV